MITRDAPGIYWPVIVLTLVVFLVWAEYGSQSCLTQQCHVNVPRISPGDSKAVAVNKIVAAVNNNHTLVNWRRAMIFAIIAAVVVLFVFSPRKLPSGRVFLLTSAVFFVVFYFFSTIDQEINHRPLDEAIESALLHI